MRTPQRKTETLNRTDARYAARWLVTEAGHHYAEVIEGFFPGDNCGTFIVKSQNRCWCGRTYKTLAEVLDDNEVSV